MNEEMIAVCGLDREQYAEALKRLQQMEGVASDSAG